jgi:hypothetical protein
MSTAEVSQVVDEQLAECACFRLGVKEGGIVESGGRVVGTSSSQQAQAVLVLGLIAAERYKLMSATYVQFAHLIDLRI